VSPRRHGWIAQTAAAAWLILADHELPEDLAGLADQQVART